ncbi:MAG: WcbI family polysaccharide biosynthesis putative acetyltransferase [Aquihabitans sp.]
MGRQIVVMSNCQTGGLHATLAGMLPDDTVRSTMWLGHEPADLAELLPGADVLVTTATREEANELVARHGSSAEIFVVPSLYFRALHPDLSQFLVRGGGELTAVAGPYHSKIVVWGWQHGMTPDEILARFTTDMFARLGYLEQWAEGVAQLRTRFEPTDIDFASWYLPIVRRGAFMLTNNHPRFDALVQMARPIATRLGADPALVAYPWEHVLPDGLMATSVVWPIYPGVGPSLDLPGAYVWRLASGELIGLERFVSASLATYYELDPSTIDIDHLDADPRFAAVLGAGSGRVSQTTGGR